VDNGQDVHKVVSNRVEHPIWEAWKQGATNASNDFRVELRRLLETFELQFDRSQEFVAKPRATRLVPLVRLTHITQGSRGKLYAVRHEPSCRRDFNCSHE
jgi:hypothetical protein